MFKEVQAGLAKAARQHNIEFKSDLDSDTVLGLMAAAVVQELLPKPAPQPARKPNGGARANASPPAPAS